MSHSQSIKGGIDPIEDEWMFEWCDGDWGELLQPAPLSIAVLSLILVIASSTSDFSLVSEDDTSKLTRIKHPKSFKACLVQMANSGHKAFKTASSEMSCIKTASSQLPGLIRKATAIVRQQSPNEIRSLLPDQLKTISEFNDMCKNASSSCEKTFSNTSALAEEITECLVCKIGSAEQTTKSNEVRILSLKTQVDHDEQMLQEAKEIAAMMAKSFADAEKEFKTAIEAQRSSGKLGRLVGKLGNIPALGKAGNALKRCLFSGKGKTMEISEAVLSDPGVSLAQQLLDLVTKLDRLIFGGHSGKPEFDAIRGSNERGIGSPVETALEKMMCSLDRTKPISVMLQPIVEKAIQITKEVDEMAKVTGDDYQTLDKYKQVMKAMIGNLQEIVEQCKPALKRTQDSVESRNSKVNLMRSHFEAARESYEKASSRLLKDQAEITETIAAMTNLSLDNVTLNEIIRVLKDAVAAFNKFARQFSDMTELFTEISTLIKVRMVPQVELCTSDIASCAKMLSGDTKLSGSTLNTIYDEMKGPLKASMLTERISTTYLRVSKDYIMPANRELGDMLAFEEGGDREEFIRKLTQTRGKILAKSQMASEKIRELVEEDQKKYIDTINQRLKTMRDVDTAPPPYVAVVVIDKKGSATEEIPPPEKSTTYNTPALSITA